MRHPGTGGQLFLLTMLSVCAACFSSVMAGEARIAAASNFRETALEIGKAFQENTGHQAMFSFGSTGQLYTQITQGAPFDVFLAADQDRPAQAVRENHGLPDSVFTYAVGKLVLYSTDENLVNGSETLETGAFTRIAIASPATAPYGAAAMQVMQELGVLESLQPRVVFGMNIAQTYQFVATHNAELGFIALSQIAGTNAGSRWLVPEDLHDPIAQDAVVLKHGAGNAAAIAFAAFLEGPQARLIIEHQGYALPGKAGEKP